MPGLKLVWRNGVAYACGNFDGKRIRQSLGTRDGERAAEALAHYEAKLWKRRSYGEAAVRTFEEAAVSYMEAGGERTFLPPLIKRFKGRVLATIMPEELRQAARALYPGRKPATWNREAIAPARAVINHAAALGWCPRLGAKSYPVEKVKRNSASREWMDAFLAQADADGLPHLAAVVLFMHQTGARVSEAVNVLPEHVDLTARVVLLAKTKTGEWERRHITRELMIRLANLPMTEGRPIFGYRKRWGIDRRMRAVVRRAGIPWRSSHEAGRHSYATNALAGGATVREVMEGGGWKSASLVLGTYAHADDGGKKIAGLFDAGSGTDRSQKRRKSGK